MSYFSFDPVWVEVIARVGLTWQETFESVTTCSVPGITLPLRLSPTLVGKTPTISLSEQLWCTSGTLHPPLRFRPMDRVLLAVPLIFFEFSAMLGNEIFPNFCDVGLVLILLDLK